MFRSTIFQILFLLVFPFFPCFSEEEFDEKSFLEAAIQHTKFERLRQKNFSLIKEKLRPRGASLDGRFAVFEKRSIIHPHLITFIVFDTKNGTRNFFFSPTQKTQRKNILSSIQLETQYIENTISLFQNINQTKATVSFTYAEILLEIYRESISQNLLLDIWKVLPLQKRQLFCRYPISESPFVEAKIQTIYSFDKNNGFSVQIISESSNQALIDILSFHLEKGFSILASKQLAKQTFALSLKDRNQAFLKDIFFALGAGKKIEKEKVYFLGGLSKEVFYNNLAAPSE